MDWQPIETAPKDGTKILVWPRSRQMREPAIAYWHQPANSDYPGFWAIGGNPTHWMPLPAPPVIS